MPSVAIEDAAAKIAERAIDRRRRGVATPDPEKAPAWFHEYQSAAWLLACRVIAIIAGWQSGKTVFGPYWLLREIFRCGPGDYGVGAPTFRLMDKKVLPEFKAIFRPYGAYNKSEFVFTFSDEGQRLLWGEAKGEVKVFFGYAENPDSLESATYKAFWGDECGQDAFKAESHSTIVSRVMVHRGRILYTSRPYNFDWFKTEVSDKAGLRIEEDEETGLMSRTQTEDDPHTGVVSFPSTANPSQDREAIDREKRRMPAWEWGMKYGGRFTRPAGAIYDCFDRERNTCSRFEIPDWWERRHIGVDFGGVNTAAVWAALDPQSPEDAPRWYVYRSYRRGRLPIHDRDPEVETHASNLLEGMPMDRRGKPILPIAFGGSGSEEQWREEFGRGGLPIQEPPYSDVEVGIKKVYGMLVTGALVLFDDLTKLISEIETYSRELDQDGQPTAKIKDKETRHRADALRYLVSGLEDDGQASVSPRSGNAKPEDEQEEEGPDRAGRGRRGRIGRSARAYR